MSKRSGSPISVFFCRVGITKSPNLPMLYIRDVVLSSNYSTIAAGMQQNEIHVEIDALGDDTAWHDGGKERLFFECLSAHGPSKGYTQWSGLNRPIYNSEAYRPIPIPFLLDVK